MMKKINRAEEIKINNFIKIFWEERAELDYLAGSNDFILKELETREIIKKIGKNSKILEVGCGNGETLIKLAKEKNCRGIGIDFASNMITLANRNAKKSKVDDMITFEIGHVSEIEKSEKFDYALTQRCLVSLDGTEHQIRAIKNIMRHLKSHGTYIMVENCIQGHNRLNDIRTKIGLKPMDIYWFNFFLNADEVANWKFDNFYLESGPISLCSTYYLLSRVIYAKLEQDKGTKIENLKYDSDINKLAFSIPNIGNIGASTMWIWKKL